jgi:hypothetical protein
MNVKQIVTPEKIITKNDYELMEIIESIADDIDCFDPTVACNYVKYLVDDYIDKTGTTLEDLRLLIFG